MIKLISHLFTSDHRLVVLMRFVAVGGFFSLAYSLLSIAFAAGTPLRPHAASVTAYLICIPPAYLTQRALAFRSSVSHRRAFPRYLALQAPLMGLGALLSWIFISKLHWRLAAFLLIGPVVAVISFAVQRAWTFANQ